MTLPITINTRPTYTHRPQRVNYRWGLVWWRSALTYGTGSGIAYCRCVRNDVLYKYRIQYKLADALRLNSAMLGLSQSTSSACRQLNLSSRTEVVEQSVLCGPKNSKETGWTCFFLLLVPQRGMHFQPTYAASMTLLHLNVNLRLICLP